LLAFSTTVAADGIEDIRRSLGGHGYSLASGLGTLYRNYVSTNTVEGENILMTMQAARYLMKLARQLKQGDEKARERMGTSPVTAYMARLYETESACRATTQEEFCEPKFQIDAFNHRARRLVAECFESVTRFQGDLGMAAPEAAAVSVAHCQNLIVTLFWAKIAELEKQGADAGCLRVLKNLAALNGLSLMAKYSGEFLEDGYFSGKQAKTVRAAREF
jgi:acyl-CoA oxidase